MNELQEMIKKFRDDYHQNGCDDNSLTSLSPSPRPLLLGIKKVNEETLTFKEIHCLDDLEPYLNKIIAFTTYEDRIRYPNKVIYGVLHHHKSKVEVSDHLTSRNRFRFDSLGHEVNVLRDVNDVARAFYFTEEIIELLKEYSNFYLVRAIVLWERDLIQQRIIDRTYRFSYLNEDRAMRCLANYKFQVSNIY